MPCTYVRIVGDGRVYQGRCLLRGILFLPLSAGEYVDVYDGLDAVSGEKVCRIVPYTNSVHTFYVPCGVVFNHGIYIDGYDDEVETTVFFEPLEL